MIATTWASFVVVAWAWGKVLNYIHGYIRKRNKLTYQRITSQTLGRFDRIRSTFFQSEPVYSKIKIMIGTVWATAMAIRWSCGKVFDCIRPERERRPPPRIVVHSHSSTSVDGYDTDSVFPF